MYSRPDLAVQTVRVNRVPTDLGAHILKSKFLNALEFTEECFARDTLGRTSLYKLQKVTWTVYINDKNETKTHNKWYDGELSDLDDWKECVNFLDPTRRCDRRECH